MRRSIYLGGYTLDEKGVRMWPLRRYTGYWIDLADVQVRRADGQHAHYSVALRFSARPKPVNVRVGAGLSNLRLLVQAFTWIRQAVPPGRDSQRLLFEDFISGASGISEERLSTEHPSDEERLARARVWWLALDPKRALRECTPLLLGGGRLEVEAALLAIDAHLAVGNPEKAAAVLEKTEARHRDNPRLAVRGAALLLDLDDARGPAWAEKAVFADASAAPLVGLHWTWYHFRARRWSEASDVLDRVERRAHPLSPEFAAEFARVREEIAACRASPARGLRQTIGRRGWAMLLQVGLPVLVLALMAWPIATMGPVFFAESRKLVLLETSGIRVDGAGVRELRRHDVRETNLSELRYVFAPDVGTAGTWEPPDLGTMDRASLDAYVKRITAGELPEGWHRGTAILYDSTAREIAADPARQFVTYLREDPSVNTIGPITGTRVWFTWLAGGKAAFMAVVAVAILVYLAFVIGLDVLRSRVRRRKAGS